MKVDFKKSIDSYKAKGGDFQIVTVPPLQYLFVDGRGDPDTSPDFVSGIEALYPLAYALRSASASDLDRDYVIPPLEGLWWVPGEGAFSTDGDKSAWLWMLMIMTPTWITAPMFDAAVARTTARKKVPARIGKVRLESLDEGECVQILHVGSYDDEEPTIHRMHDEFIPSHALREQGRHHEIYFSDPQRVPPEKLRTILRQPVRRLPA